ncbi:hypothetical protein BKG93_09325 [Rodentibacter ratti]|uniref:Lipoprotein n=1 Tax=Rodentibacter ratti TaxID=1906745 RepID=A0A1V3L1J9_9PAST|nr:hypothetical protein [Rodentibacter ratti]OOF83711.1 hypothetical protein BKG93_09325 [Rodentibacter ratti]
MKKYLLVGLFSLFLIACSSLPTVQTLPPQPKTERLFKVEQRDLNGDLKQASLLSLSAQPTAWRWVQSDPLGSPIARVILNNNGWQNDGFVMPNQQAKQLFSAIATALNTTPLFAFSHIERTLQATTYFVNKKQVWRIIPQQSGIDIELPDMSYWHIEELN